MSGISPVTIALIEQRPLTAVKTVSGMDPHESAAFLETLPTRHAVSILSRMSAWLSASVIARMSPIAAAAILSDLDYQTTASILRIIPEAERETLLKALPKKLCGSLVSTLTYPADTVGAKMSTTIVVMTIDDTAADALRELRHIKRAKTGLAYVVDGSKKLLGIVSAEELLQRPNEALLSEIMDRSIVPISARARLNTILSLPGWDDYAHMPVINRQKVLIGSLARRTLRKPTTKSAHKVVDLKNPSIFALVSGAFATSAIGVLDVLMMTENLSGVAENDQPVDQQGGKS